MDGSSDATSVTSLPEILDDHFNNLEDVQPGSRDLSEQKINSSRAPVDPAMPGNNLLNQNAFTVSSHIS